MNDVPVSNIIRQVRTLRPEDSIGKAAEAVRASGLTELPVIVDGRVVGTATERAILNALTEGDPREVAEQPVSAILSEQTVFLNRHMTVRQVAEVLRDHDLQVAPVINEWNGYMGIVTRSDVAGALCLTMRPPSIAGMATPLGVYLTTGHLRAGAGDLGLMLTGVALMLINFASTGIVAGLAWLVQKVTPLQLWNMLNYFPAKGFHADWLRGLMLYAGPAIFLLLIRVLPLAGYHAAEHQVVHAIENGEPLKPANVSVMPRAHPRCGTNIMAALILFTMISDRFSPEVAVPIAVLIFLFAWRNIGSYMQNFLTTKPATRKQLDSGIRAGEELLEKYRTNPAYQVTGWRRIWNTGLPQVMVGVAVTTAAAGQLLHKAWPRIFF